VEALRNKIILVASTSIYDTVQKFYALDVGGMFRYANIQSELPVWRSGYSVGRKDLMILASGVRIPLWDVGAGQDTVQKFYALDVGGMFRYANIQSESPVWRSG
jgi:hypothetical protein